MPRRNEEWYLSVPGIDAPVPVTGYRFPRFKVFVERFFTASNHLINPSIQGAGAVKARNGLS
ncbi:MAG: hypothetical protein ACFFD4_17915 [Candidatus Odinarchaeota archaeon]